MIAALSTLAFLVILWLLVVAGAAVLEESGAKIAATLKGRPADQPRSVVIRMRARPQPRQPRRAEQRLRAAA